MATPVVEQLVEQRVLVLNGVEHVPPYSLDGFVSPGYGRHHTKLLTEEQLYAAGAKELIRSLWPRPRYPRKETLQ